jgi:hypothetical protein
MADERLEYCCEAVHNILIFLNLFVMIIIYVQHLSSIADIRFSNGTVAWWRREHCCIMKGTGNTHPSQGM